MKKAAYLVLSLGVVLFLGIVFYGNVVAQATFSRDAGDDLVVDAEAYDFEAEVETTEDNRPRNNGGMIRDDYSGRMMGEYSDEDCPFRREGRYLDEDCPFRGEGRRRMSGNAQESEGSSGRMMSNSERPCSRRR